MSPSCLQTTKPASCFPNEETEINRKISTKAQKAVISTEDAFRATRKSVRALMLIRAYRVNGHLIGNLDPLHGTGAPRPTSPATSFPLPPT